MKDFEAFLPTYSEVRRCSDRLKKVSAALFPGYLFCRLDAEHRLPILTTVGVASIRRGWWRAMSNRRRGDRSNTQGCTVRGYGRPLAVP